MNKRCESVIVRAAEVYIYNWWSLVFVAPPIDSRLVDMTNYLVHKTYTSGALAIYFYLKKISWLILFSQAAQSGN